eukprot:528328-Rhodomonas_salina.1
MLISKISHSQTGDVRTADEGCVPLLALSSRDPQRITSVLSVFPDKGRDGAGEWMPEGGAGRQ